MNCETATNLISSLIDGEISSSDQSALDAHLSTCPSCRATLETLRAQDNELQKAFTPRRATAQSHREHIQSFRPRRFPFFNTLFSAAAGFAIAFLILQPWKKPPVGNPGQIVTTQPTTPGIAHLALATGAIEILPPSEKTWQPMLTGASIAPGSRIRTPDKTRCELVMSDDSTIRLNSNTQVLVGSLRHFDLDRGQMWSSISPAATAFTVSVASASITALGTEFGLIADQNKK